MDITFQTGEGRFNLRACAVILHEESLLAMHDERSPYFYLPGGRIQLHETAQQAVRRELWEELGVEADIIRPLWLNQAFFTEEVSREKFHELCVYFLVDVEHTGLPAHQEPWEQMEGKRRHTFEWLPLSRLGGEYLYPLFLKDRIFHLPESLELMEEFE